MGEKQHYIPRFYLKNFSDKNRQAIGIFRFEKQNLIEAASIKNIAYRKYFYDNDDVIESKLAKIEGSWSNLINIYLGQISENEINYYLERTDFEIIYDVLQFFALMHARTAQSGDSLLHSIKSMETKFKDKMKPETYNKYFGMLTRITNRS